jgi:hypothetical protein
VDYNPLKGMLVLISSLRLSILSYATGPESWGQHMAIDVKLLPKFHCSLEIILQVQSVIGIKIMRKLYCSFLIVKNKY